MNGEGEFFWPNGKFFKGFYKDDKKEGPGIFTWPDGKELKAIWHKGEIIGDVTLIDEAGVSRKVDFDAIQSFDINDD